MAAYFRKAGSWSEHLQAQAYVDDITTEVSRSAREQVASIEALGRDNIRVNESVAAAVGEVENAVWAVDESIQRLDATFRWGFSTLIAQVGSLGQSVEELVRIAKIPNRIRAYEYYSDSRDAYCRNIFDVAQATIDKAINGDSQSMTGYQLDWRFFHQKALVNLGGKGELHRFVNLDVAGECAARAVDLAVSAGDLQGASVAAFTASWADYCRQRYDSALVWAIKAVDFDPKHSAAAFQASKVLMALGKPQDALQYLLSAVVLDRRFVIESLDENDGDFAPHRSIVTEAFEGLRIRIITELTTDLRILLVDPAVWTYLLSSEEESKNWLTIVESLLVIEPSAMLLFDVLQLREWRQTRLIDVKPLPDGWTVDLMSRALAAADRLAAISRLLEKCEDLRVRTVSELTNNLTVALADSNFWTTRATTDEARERFGAINALLGTPESSRLSDVIRLAVWQRSQDTQVASNYTGWTVRLLSQAVDATRGLSAVHKILEQVAARHIKSEKEAISTVWIQIGFGVAAVVGVGLIGQLCASSCNGAHGIQNILGKMAMGVFGCLGAILLGLAFWGSVVALSGGVIWAIFLTIAKQATAGRWRSALR